MLPQLLKEQNDLCFFLTMLIKAKVLSQYDAKNRECTAAIPCQADQWLFCAAKYNFLFLNLKFHDSMHLLRLYSKVGSNLVGNSEAHLPLFL